MDLDLKHDLQRQLGLWEFEIGRFFIRYARGMKTAIDVGAGDGYYTLYFLAKTEAKSVFAFEPSQHARHSLERNAGLNGYRIGDRLILSSQSVKADMQGGGTPLDLLAAAVTPPCIVKIDVEGMEAAVLAGAKRLLASPGIMWIIETHSLSLEQECRERLVACRLETEVVSPAWWRVLLPELRSLPHNRWLVATRL